MKGADLIAARQEMYRLITAGASTAEIAERTGLSVKTIQRTRRSVQQSGADAPDPASDRFIGDETECEIGRLLDEGRPAKEIAAETGAALATIYKRMSGRRDVRREAGQELRDAMARVQQIGDALAAQGRLVDALADRIERLEARIDVIVPARTESVIRDLTAERDLYRTGARSMQIKADRLAAHLRDLGAAPDDTDNGNNGENGENGADDDRAASQDMDGAGAAPADEESEADARRGAGLE